MACRRHGRGHPLPRRKIAGRAASSAAPRLALARGSARSAARSAESAQRKSYYYVIETLYLFGRRFLLRVAGRQSWAALADGGARRLDMVGLPDKHRAGVALGV